MNDLVWVIQSVHNSLLSIYYMSDIMNPEDTTTNLKHPCAHEAYMGETNSHKKKKKVEN